MKTKRVLDVGNCGPDHGSISRMLVGKFSVEVSSADTLAQTLALLKQEQFDLVLVNRKLDIDYSDGLEIIQAMKSDPDTSDVPVMLVTNFAEHQDTAVAAGALRGFGKLELETTETFEKLSPLLLET